MKDAWREEPDGSPIHKGGYKKLDRDKWLGFCRADTCRSDAGASGFCKCHLNKVVTLLKRRFKTALELSHALSRECTCND